MNSWLPGFLLTRDAPVEAARQALARFPSPVAAPDALARVLRARLDRPAACAPPPRADGE